jgi:hypothetical protein
MRTEFPISSSRLKMGGGGESTFVPSVGVLSVGVLSNLDLSIVDLFLIWPLKIGLSPPDMQAHTLSSSGVAGCNKEQ